MLWAADSQLRALLHSLNERTQECAQKKAQEERTDEGDD